MSEVKTFREYVDTNICNVNMLSQDNLVDLVSRYLSEMSKLENQSESRLSCYALNMANKTTVKDVREARTRFDQICQLLEAECIKESEIIPDEWVSVKETIGIALDEMERSYMFVRNPLERVFGEEKGRSTNE